MGRENKEVREMPTWCGLTFVLPTVSSHLSVFSKLCIMNTLLRFLSLLCQSCRTLRNKFLGGRILGLIKSSHHGWLSMMTSSEGPFFSLASGPPTLNPPLSSTIMFRPIRIVQMSSLATACIGQPLLTFWSHTEQSWMFAMIVAALKITHIALHRYCLW